MNIDIHDLPHGRQVREWMRTMNRLQPFRNQRAIIISLVSAAIISIVMTMGAISPVDHHIEPNFHLPFVVVCNTLLFYSLYSFNFAVIRYGLKQGWLMAVGVVGSLAIAAIFTLVAYWAECFIYETPFNNYTTTLISNTSSAFIAYLLTLLLHNVTRYQQAIIENEHLQAENIRTHHEALKQQVSPHFLFNSLNTLDGLIGNDDERAHTYLAQLAATFRYTLQQNKVVTLADELQFTHSYIYMMQIRYGESLIVEEHIAPEMLTCNIAPISIQLLVENAIKHNVITLRRPLKVTIATTDDRAITVSNPLQPKPDQAISNGIGLANLSQRYNILFGRDISIQNDGATFSVTLPLI